MYSGHCNSHNLLRTCLFVCVCVCVCVCFIRGRFCHGVQLYADGSNTSVRIEGGGGSGCLCVWIVYD